MHINKLEVNFIDFVSPRLMLRVWAIFHVCPTYGMRHIPDILSEFIEFSIVINKKVQVGKDQENAQSEKDSHPKNRGEKTKLTIRNLYHDNIS